MADADLSERGLRDPQAVFGTPEAVLESRELTPDEKRAILRRWHETLPPAERHEAAASGQPTLATRLFRALSFVDTETGERQTTHDQGFYTSVSDIDDGRK